MNLPRGRTWRPFPGNSGSSGKIAAAREGNLLRWVLPWAAVVALATGGVTVLPTNPALL